MKSDLKSYSFIFKQEGTAQNERYPDALNPAAIAIDDRKIEDFIVFARRYYKNILFVPTEDGAEVDLKQSWDIFFKNDAIFLMAGIATKETADIKGDYDRLRNQFNEEPSIENFTRIAEFVLSRFKKIDEWYATASANTSLSNNLQLYIKSYLSKELIKLNEILNYLHSLRKSNEKLLHLESLFNKNDIWEFLEKRLELFDDDLFNGKTEEERLRNGLFSLDEIFDTVFRATSNIIRICDGYFTSDIYNRQNHPPHIALFVAFLGLYGVVQEELNKIPQRLLEYYYKDVLAIKPQKAIPDKTFVVFELAKGFDAADLKKGTALTAGKDSRNIDLIYKTDRDIVVNKSQVSALKTIFIQKNKNGIFNYYAKTIKRNGANADQSGVPWSVFGGPEKDCETEIGLAICSTQLYLAKGERNVTLILEVQDKVGFDEMETQLINLRLTGEKGWISSANPDDHVTINYLKKTGEKNVELNFSISIAQQSAVVAFNEALHGGRYNTSYPVLEILLLYPSVPLRGTTGDYDKYITKIKQLNALQEIMIVGTEINVQVGSIDQTVNFDGVRDLTLQNHESVLDSKKPFFPFTAMPQVGSSFYIGCDDLYYKPIQTLSLNFEWMLPDNFGSYYDKYFPPYDSNKFTASLSILENQHWKKLSDFSIIDSFANEPKYKLLTIDPQKSVEEKVTDSKKDVSKFDVTKHDGTLKIKLNYPDFGHSIYPQLITAAVMEKATSKLAAVDFYKIVKNQLNDSVISIKYPDDISNRTGSLKVIVYDVLEKITDDERARAMMIGGLEVKLKGYNGSNVSFTQMQQSPGGVNAASQNKELVNDDNSFEWILKFLKKVKLIDKSIHLDKDKEDLETVADDIDDKIEEHADVMLPSDQKMVDLIISEVNATIRKVVVIIVNKLITLRSKKMPDGKTVEAILKKEIDDANDVINDAIARKIAILLSANDVPPKPYTPLVNTFSISYSSAKKLESGEAQYFQILPFGVREIDPGSTPAFPGYLINQSDSAARPSGLLLIGIKDIYPNQNLSLLFLVAEGTRTSDRKPLDVSWWFLKNNEWVTLDDKYLVLDSTYGLQTTGIIEVSVPEDVNYDNTILDEDGLFWLGISVARDIDAFPRVIDIKTQAAVVTFEDNNNDPEHLSLPLPAKKIANLVEKLPYIKSVSQPVASQNGKVQERESEFYTRVSERLRHKNRAINNWDYERLVLERFPYIFKVKCLNNYSSGKFLIGHVTLVPIIDLTNKTGDEIQTELPRASFTELKDIEQFIKTKSSPFVKIHVINPQLDYVKISCTVAFGSGLDKGYYLKKLNDDLVLFLTPWATGNNDTISFSVKIYASSIISFIDKLPYVDYVTDFSMSQYTLQGGTEFYCETVGQSTALVETQFTTGHSILVSAPSHDIQLA